MEKQQVSYWELEGTYQEMGKHDDFRGVKQCNPCCEQFYGNTYCKGEYAPV